MLFTAVLRTSSQKKGGSIAPKRATSDAEETPKLSKRTRCAGPKRPKIDTKKDAEHKHNPRGSTGTAGTPESAKSGTQNVKILSPAARQVFTFFFCRISALRCRASGQYAKRAAIFAAVAAAAGLGLPGACGVAGSTRAEYLCPGAELWPANTMIQNIRDTARGLGAFWGDFKSPFNRRLPLFIYYVLQHRFFNIKTYILFI